MLSNVHLFPAHTHKELVMMLHFHFVNTNYANLSDYRRVLGGGEMCAHFYHDDLANIAPLCDTFVSASNSRLFYDGGSDLCYMRLFNNLGKVMNEQLRAEVWDRQPTVFGSRCTVPHLPVGAALAAVLPLASDATQLRTFIAAPTMLLPQVVRDTRNAYHAFKMVLELIDKLPAAGERHVLMPGLADGIGGMDSAVSAAQILQAWRDHQNGDMFDVLTDTAMAVHNPAAMRTQPRYFMNTLYFNFETNPEDIQGMPRSSALTAHFEKMKKH